MQTIRSRAILSLTNKTNGGFAIDLKRKMHKPHVALASCLDLGNALLNHIGLNDRSIF